MTKGSIYLAGPQRAGKAARHNSSTLMEVLDQLNAKDGCGTLYFAGQGIQPQWQMKRDMLSPRYTTRFSDLLVVR